MSTERDLRDIGRVELASHATLAPTNAGAELVTVSVGPGGEAIALWATSAGAEAMRSQTVSPGFAKFPDSRTERPVAARVSTYHPSLAHEVEIRDLEIGFPMIQPLPQGRTLIVGARCEWRPEGAERNAIVIDADGLPVANGTLGDGIAEVLTTPSGQIWVGYFDEGVFGNYGWGTPGPAPIGSHGIVRFTSELTATWQYPYDAEGGAIADVYALNVDGETAWSCYYTDFPIIRIESDAITTWRGGPSGAKALIVDGSRCVLIGGYGAERDRVLIGSLTPDGFVPEASGVLSLPGGAKAGRRRLVARGAELHAFVGARWYKTAVADLAKLIS